MSQTTRQPILEVQQATKRFPGVLALDGVDLTVHPGECLALIGENGAGKSTLMKILAGVQEPDAGRILIDGKPVRIQSVQRALELGIALIHQELNLADNLDVASNIYLGREPRFGGPLKFIDRSRIHRDSRQYLDRVGLDCPSKRIVSTLSIGQQQMVEIAKALSSNARILIMDEPTSSLSTRETEALFQVVHQLKKENVAIIYISHRLGEVKELADRVKVMRDGQNAGELQKDEIARDRMVSMMVGRDLESFYARSMHGTDKTVLRVEKLRTLANPEHEVSFTLNAGEIVGMAGLVGAGRTELLRVLFGVEPAVGGTVEVEGRKIVMKSPRDAIDAGIALVPEDRKQQGLVVDMTVRENTSLACIDHHARAGFLDRRQERDLAGQMIDKLRIKTPGPEQIARHLSGGNQQKVVIGKWLATSPRVLLLDEPTRGIDVGAKQEIYQLMEQLARQGVAILFVSSEMEEVLGMSDKALVMHEGRLAGMLRRDQLSEEAIMHLATGGAPAQDVHP